MTCAEDVRLTSGSPVRMEHFALQTQELCGKSTFKDKVTPIARLSDRYRPNRKAAEGQLLTLLRPG